MAKNVQRAEQSGVAYLHEHLPAHILASSEHAGWHGITAQLCAVGNLTPSRIQLPGVREDIIAIQTAGVTELQGKITRRFQRVASHPGTLFFTPAGVPTEWEWTESCEVFNLFLAPNLLATVATETAHIEPARIELIDHAAYQDPLIYQIGLALLAELETGGFAGRIYADALTHTLAVHLLRNHVVFTQQVQDYQRGLTALMLRRVLDYINDNLAQDLALNKIAALTHLSSYHFTRLFKQSTGIALHQYVIERRIEAAKRLLATTDISIATIAVRVGFHDHSHFYRHFKRIIGVSPRAWRNDQRPTKNE